MDINSIEDVRKISKKNTNRVTFKLQSLSDLGNKSWERSFNRLLNDCGCDTGKRYLSLFIPVYLTACLCLLIFTSLSFSTVTSLFMGAVIATGITSKVVAIVIRDRKIKKLIRKIDEEGLNIDIKK